MSDHLRVRHGKKQYLLGRHRSSSSSDQGQLYIFLGWRRRTSRVLLDPHTAVDMLVQGKRLYDRSSNELTWLGKYISAALSPIFCARSMLCECYDGFGGLQQLQRGRVQVLNEVYDAVKSKDNANVGVGGRSSFVLLRRR